MAHRMPALRGFAMRAYSDSRSAGATATSKGFSKKEQAQENQYIREQERLALEKLKKQLAKHQEELDQLQKKVEEQEKKL